MGSPQPVAAGGTVGTCDQSSLDAALAGGGTVTFTTGSCTITVTSQKTITAETTIDGGGVITFSGGDTTRVFTVSNGITLTLANLTIRNGYVITDTGGAIYNNGVLVVTNTTLSRNHAVYAGSTDAYLGNGGAIHNAGTAYIINSVFSRNEAYRENSLVHPGNGGAIYNYPSEANLYITNSSFTLNSSNGGVGGGAVSSYGTLVITGTTFDSNTSQTYGGAVDDESSGMSSSNMITNSTFTNNTANSCCGGAIYVGGAKLNIAGSSFYTNTTPDRGGAIWNQAGAIGIETSSFRANQATVGPGGAIASRGSMSIRQSTFAQNAAFDNGGGISIETYGYGTLLIVNSTFFGNEAWYGGGGGIYARTTTVLITNTTFTSNTTAIANGGGNINIDAGGRLKNTILSGGLANNAPNNCAGTFTSNGYNLDSGNTCGFTATGDITDTDPLLGPLQLNAPGSTPTHALLAGSPAIDAGTNTGCASTDQRGISRPIGSACDIGAFEAIVPTLSAISPSTATVGGAEFTLILTGTNFISGATGLWNGSPRTTTFVNSTQLTAAIPASDLTVAGIVSVTVQNPASDSYTSNAQTFTITTHYYNSTSTGNWTSPSTWDAQTVPGAADTVTITTGTTVTVDSDIASLHLNIAPGGVLIIPSGATLSVSQTVTNQGTIRQAQTVNNASVPFQITDGGSNVRYRLANINTVNDLGTVTVMVRALNTGEYCTTTGTSSPAYVRRCFQITATNNNTATVSLWALTSELNGITETNLSAYRYEGSSPWTELTDRATGNDGGSYSYTQGNTPGFSHFLIGQTGAGNGPTVITLRSFVARRNEAVPVASVLALGMIAFMVGMTLRTGFRIGTKGS